MNYKCTECSKSIEGFVFYNKGNFRCYDCEQPACDKCYAEDGLISFDSDNNQRTFCYRCLQEKLDDKTYKLTKK